MGWGALVIGAGGLTLWLNGGTDAPSQRPEPEFGWFPMSPEPSPMSSEPAPASPDFSLEELPTGGGSAG
ncbi:hypothetical protein GCM10010361_47660 [Streptomyces olivaceiscleroticus]|uniref:Serine/threonine protein kinase n=1 Tax=Streptomyces olivaceiscleroticus TaxID=68245 RepID=A0ABP3KED0_9ACTN